MVVEGQAPHELALGQQGALEVQAHLVEVPEDQQVVGAWTLGGAVGPVDQAVPLANAHVIEVRGHLVDAHGGPLLPRPGLGEGAHAIPPET